MSRSKAKKILNVEDFKEEMKDVWSATVGQSTLDEGSCGLQTCGRNQNFNW